MCNLKFKKNMRSVRLALRKTEYTFLRQVTFFQTSFDLILIYLHLLPLNNPKLKLFYYFCKPEKRNRPFLFIFLLAEPHGYARKVKHIFTVQKKHNIKSISSSVRNVCTYYNVKNKKRKIKRQSSHMLVVLHNIQALHPIFS